MNFVLIVCVILFVEVFFCFQTKTFVKISRINFFFKFFVQVPAGRIAEKYGGKYVYGYGILITTIFTLLTPLAAKISVPALVITRIFTGLGEGVTFPSMHAMLAKCKFSFNFYIFQFKIIFR